MSEKSMTNFDEFIKNAWADHANKPSEVAGRFNEAFKLVERNEQIPSMAQLMTHVMGEHLGQWQQGIDHLKRLQRLACFDSTSESQNALQRSIASLEVAHGKIQVIEAFNLSDQIRILAAAASALVGQSNTLAASDLFQLAIEKSKQGLAKTDPANRALAITGNNLASLLEEKAHRTALEVDLMLLAAQTARMFWEVAGTWLEVERAEYRLAQSYLKANQLELSLKHAKNCLVIAQANKADPLELFFGYEVLALVERARENHDEFMIAIGQMELNFRKLSDDDKSWCEPILKALSK